MLATLTTPDVAKDLWPSRMGRKLRQEFHGSEQTFLTYVAALHERNIAGPKYIKAQ
jgi:hypothetical protein